MNKYDAVKIHQCAERLKKCAEVLCRPEINVEFINHLAHELVDMSIIMEEIDARIKEFFSETIDIEENKNGDADSKASP